MKETDVGAAVVAHFERENWDTFQEVPFNGACADVVVTSQSSADGPYPRKVLGVIECKVHLSFDLMAQAWRWRTCADFVWIAAPVIRRSDAYLFARDVVRRYGFGLLEVHFDAGTTRVYQRENPRPMKEHRVVADTGRFIATLKPQHKTAKMAGSNRGSAYTEFRSTTDQLVDLVRLEPGVRIHDAVLRIQHHYPTPRSAVHTLRRWIHKGTGGLSAIEFRDLPGKPKGSLFLKEGKKE